MALLSPVFTCKVKVSVPLPFLETVAVLAPVESNLPLKETLLPPNDALPE